MSGTGVAIGAGMKAAAVGVHTPPKRQIRTVVPSENLPAIIRVEHQLGHTRRLKEVPMPRLKGVGGIRDPTHRAYPLLHTRLMSNLSVARRARCGTLAVSLTLGNQARIIHDSLWRNGLYVSCFEFPISSVSAMGDSRFARASPFGR